MLTGLHVRGLAVVEELDLEFGAGFTALTGETGAGKSIIIDALGLALGESADPAGIRPGCAQCEIAARFTVTPQTAALLEEWGYPCDGDEMLARRVLRAQGSRAWLNGSPVALRQLKKATAHLVEVRGQYAQLQLLAGARQRELLDHYAGHGELLAEVGQRYREWHALRQRLDRLDALAPEEPELLRHYVEELRELDCHAGEPERLEQEQSRLRNADRLGASLGEAARRLDDMEDLGAAWRILADCARLDTALEPLAAEIQQAQEQAAEAGRRLSAYLDGLESNTARLHEVEQRLDTINALAHKHRIAADALPEKLAQLETELATLESAVQDRGTLERQCKTALEHYLEPALALSAGRRDAAGRMDADITATMQRLGMSRGKCHIEVRHPPQAPPAQQGLDQVEFTAAINPGLPLRPLARAASGGELSRLYLAAYSLARGNADAALIFDELDTGVGGAVAERIGRLLSELAESRQILCITHLPQVACQARHHLHVSKHTRSGQTFTEVQPLDGEGRIREIARMLGGMRITERTLAHAREMLHA